MLQRMLNCCMNFGSQPNLLNNNDTIEHVSVADTSSVVSIDDIDIREQQNEIDRNIDWKDTVQFVPPIITGVVIKVYDGDTITIASKLPYPESPIYRFSVRLNGIDCPEIKGKDENEKECAKIAKEEMTKLAFKEIVTLKNVQTEKYGRILADVYVNDINLNNHLLEQRLAVKYDGGTKICPRNWMDYYCKGEL